MKSATQRRAVKRTAIGSGLVFLAIVLGVGQAVAQTPDGPPAEGIKVHGDWTLVGRNGDGSEAWRTEFKNRLAVPGDEPYAGVGNRILAGLLSRSVSAGLWEIHLHGVNIEVCFDGSSQVPFGCVITEPGSTAAGSNFFRTLTVTPDLQNGTLTLKGSARVQTPTPGILKLAITHVSTAFRTCSAATAPAAPCTSIQGGGNFTKTEVPGPQPSVVFDQTIDVTVVISFS